MRMYIYIFFLRNEKILIKSKKTTKKNNRTGKNNSIRVSSLCEHKNIYIFYLYIFEFLKEKKIRKKSNKIRKIANGEVNI
jgi:hypothetical protein